MKRKTKNLLLVSLSIVFAITCLGLIKNLLNDKPIIPPVDSSDTISSEESTINPSEEISLDVEIAYPHVTYYGFEGVFDEEHNEQMLIDNEI